MKYSFDAYQLYLAATSSICSYVPLPPYPAWPSVTVTVVKESSTRSLFSFCYDILDSHLSLLSRIHIHLFFLSLHCAVNPNLPTMFFPSFIFYLVRYPLPASFLPAFPNVFLTRAALYRFIICVAHPPPSPFCLVKSKHIRYQVVVCVFHSHRDRDTGIYVLY